MFKSCPNPDCDNTEQYPIDSDIEFCPDCDEELVEHNQKELEEEEEFND